MGYWGNCTIDIGFDNDADWSEEEKRSLYDIVCAESYRFSKGEGGLYLRYDSMFWPGIEITCRNEGSLPVDEMRDLLIRILGSVADGHFYDYALVIVDWDPEPEETVFRYDDGVWTEEFWSKDFGD